MWPFKKYPYNVRVRVVKTPEGKYIPQCALYYSFWYRNWENLAIVDNQELAEKIALAKYSSWIRFFKKEEAPKKSKAVWWHP